MLSRAAEAIFWMSRYVERAENTARVVDVNLNLILDQAATEEEQWEPIILTTGEQSAYREKYDTVSREKVLHFLTFDQENPNSIWSCLKAARENARAIRGQLTTSMFEHLNEFYLMVKNAAEDAQVLEQDAQTFFQKVRSASLLFQGITDQTLSHDEPWHFYHFGRLLERANQTSRILDVKYFVLLPSLKDVGSPVDQVQWAAVLRSASAFEMYRQNYGEILPRLVAKFLLLDKDFPRAVRHCILAAEESLHAISGSPIGTFSNPAERDLGRLSGELNYAQIEEIIENGLHEFIDHLQGRLHNVCSEVNRTFFEMQPVNLSIY